jgi:hypothetical protein
MSIVLPSAYNLARARQERGKAETCWCARTRRLHLEMAALFEARAAHDTGAVDRGSRSPG